MVVPRVDAEPEMVPGVSLLELLQQSTTDWVA